LASRNDDAQSSSIISIEALAIPTLPAMRECTTTSRASQL